MEISVVVTLNQLFPYTEIKLSENKIVAKLGSL